MAKKEMMNQILRNAVFFIVLHSVFFRVFQLRIFVHDLYVDIHNIPLAINSIVYFLTKCLVYSRKISAVDF